MITRKFIEKIHNCFDELNYREKKELNYEEFSKVAIKTIIRTKNFTDAKMIFQMFEFCIKKWKKIEKMFKYKKEVFNEYDYEGNSSVSLLPEEESVGITYITNGLTKKTKEIFVFGNACEKEDELYALINKSGKISVYEDSNFYIKNSKRSIIKMKLFDNDKNCLCDLVLSENFNVFLENNYTPYELMAYDEFIGVFKKEYIENLGENDNIDFEQLVATIEWDTLKKNKYNAISKITCFDADINFEMIFLFAVSAFKLAERYMIDYKAKNFILFNAILNR